jgi:hypothetical protein
MTDEMLFKQLSFIRNRTLRVFDALTEEQAEIVPLGFNNNIRWNLGHIYTSLDALMYGFIGEKESINQRYLQLFSMNSSPATWEGDVPSLSQLKEDLSSQLNRIQNDFTGRLDMEGNKPFNLGTVVLNTAGEVFTFGLWHEGLHQGTINSLLKVLEA